MAQKNERRTDRGAPGKGHGTYFIDMMRDWTGGRLQAADGPDRHTAGMSRTSEQASKGLLDSLLAGTHQGPDSSGAEGGGAASTSSAAASPRALGCVEGAAGSQQRPAAGAGPEKQSNNDTWAQVPSTVAGRRVEVGKISSLPEWAGDATETMGACVFAGPH